MTLRSRLTAAFMLVVLVPLLVVVGLVTTALPAAVADRQEQGLASSARLAAAVVGQLCVRARATAEAAGRATADPATLQAAIDALVDNDLADGVLVTGLDGRTLAVTGSAPPRTTTDDCVAGQVLRSAGGAQIGAAVRLSRPTGDVGWVVAAIDVDDALASRLREYANDGSEVVLLAGGQAVASSTDVPDHLVSEALRTPAPVRDGSRLAVLSPSRPGQPVAVLLVQPAEDGIRVLPYALALVVGAAALAAGIALLLARATTRPLEELGDAAARVAGGDLSTSIDVRSRDEVGRLAAAFNAMTSDLRTYVGALQHSRDELQAGVARLGETLAGTHDLDRILSVVLDAAMASTRAQAGGVLLLSGDRSGLELAVGQGLAERGVDGALRLPLGAGVVGTVARTGEAVAGRIGTGPGELRPSAGEPTGRTLVAVPLTSSTTVIGVLLLLDRADGGDFDDRDLATLRTFTSQATVAVDNVLLHEEARRLSITDGLTGLWNYRYFQMTVGKEIERASRFGRPLALLMLDLDHFKAVNDVHGHQRGDAVLVELAGRVRSEVRDVDTLARYGGEELVAVLPETDQEGAVLVAERICAAVRSRPFGGPDDVPLHITLSIGVAVFPEHGRLATELLRSADEALYVTKRGGRDAWRLAPPPGRPPVAVPS
ncbi:MAG: diguanylate cyclase with sensor [Frankiales bacterium]|nr:diguanylate cyclase with sensor [Frankiales bacterium]